MTLVNYEDYGTYDYYKTLITDLEYEDLFEEVWEAPLVMDRSEADLGSIAEPELIERVLDAAEDEWILVTMGRSPAYRLLRLPSETE